ncbi:hypothetical protein GC194_06075 [bacterium]|nr:hypothetical protein [bacterium]
MKKTVTVLALCLWSNLFLSAKSSDSLRCNYISANLYNGWSYLFLSANYGICGPKMAYDWGIQYIPVKYISINGTASGRVGLNFGFSYYNHPPGKKLHVALRGNMRLSRLCTQTKANMFTFGFSNNTYHFNRCWLEYNVGVQLEKRLFPQVSFRAAYLLGFITDYKHNTDGALADYKKWWTIYSGSTQLGLVFYLSNKK